jgi:uncharacterized membrane protein
MTNENRPDPDEKDNRFWKLGLLYFNPNDKRMFVRKRYGLGWTCNYAHPISWVLIGLVVVLLVVRYSMK